MFEECNNSVGGMSQYWGRHVQLHENVVVRCTIIVERSYTEEKKKVFHLLYLQIMIAFYKFECKIYGHDSKNRLWEDIDSIKGHYI